jgi:pectinesterase
MALLAGITPNLDELEGHGGNANVSSSVQAVVAMATPADLLSLSPENQQTVAKFLHATAEQDRAKWLFASPMHHIAENERAGPEILLLHGANDDSVPPSQSTEFARRYRDSGGRVELQILPAAPHAFWNYRPWFSPAMDRAASFLLQRQQHASSPSNLVSTSSR